MTTPLTPNFIRLPSSVPIPSPGEAVSSNSLRGFVQIIIDGIKYLYGTVDVFVFGGTINSGGAVVFQGANYTFNTVLSVAFSLFVTNDVFANSVQCNAGCKAPRRMFAAVADSAITISPDQEDVFILPGSVWTASRVLTLSHVAAVNGVSEFEVINKDPVFSIDVNDNGTGVITNVPATGGGKAKVARFFFSGGVWQTGFLSY